MAVNKIDNYYCRDEVGKHYAELLMREGYGSQASEINGIQQILNARLTKLARSFYKDGDVISGCQIRIDQESGHISAAAGQVFLNGFIWDVPAAEFDIAPEGTVSVGVVLLEEVISEKEDPELRNLARGSRNENGPGAWRKKITARWSNSGISEQTDETFFPVYTIDDGIQRSKEAPPTIDSFNIALATYDRDSTGSGTYVSSGLNVAACDNLPDGRQVYTISEGRGRVAGAAVEYTTSRRIIYPAAPDLRYITNEIVEATADAGTESGQRIDIAHPPLNNIESLRIIVEITESITHNPVSGSVDDLAHTGVTKIVKVWAGETIYEQGTDYKRSGDTVDWTPVGQEPAGGSTYQVTYQYYKDIEPEDQDLDGFTIKDAVEGTSILFGYKQRLPRYDRLAIDSEGLVSWHQGIASERSPQKPQVPNSLLLLATVYQDWRPGRKVVNDSVRVVPFDEIEDMKSNIAYCLQEIARQRLEADVSTREGGVKVGLFVDPLLDDSMRDQGISQTAAIINGDLTLPVNDAKSAFFQNDIKKCLVKEYTVKAITNATQLLRTSEMAINPYMAFDPLPAKVTLNPAIDQWTENSTNWTSPITQVFYTGSGNRTTTYRSSSTQTVSSSTTDIANLRQIDVAFSIYGFGPGEVLDSVTFDEIDVTDSLKQ